MKRNNLLIIAACVVVATLVLVIVLATGTPHVTPPPVVAIIYGSEKGDLSYTDSASRGLTDAQKTLNFIPVEYTPRNYHDITGLLNGSAGPAAPAKPGLVVTVGFQYAGETKQLAAENPKVKFLAIDQTGIGSDNLRALEITSYGDSYLAGVLAANASKTHKVGIILGMPTTLLEGFRQGFTDGVRAADQNVTIGSAYVQDTVDGFSDPVHAGEIASGMYNNGTDVIYAVAGYSGTGIIDEAKKGPGRYVIGVDSDQTYLGPSVVLASAMKRVDVAVRSGIDTFMSGSFTGGEQAVGLKEGMTELVFNPAFEKYNTTVQAWDVQAQDEELKYLAIRANGVSRTV